MYGVLSARSLRLDVAIKIRKCAYPMGVLQLCRQQEHKRDSSHWHYLERLLLLLLLGNALAGRWCTPAAAGVGVHAAAREMDEGGETSFTDHHIVKEARHIPHSLS